MRILRREYSVWDIGRIGLGFEDDDRVFRNRKTNRTTANDKMIRCIKTFCCDRSGFSGLEVPKRVHRAFTLIELLVVIAIISLLVSILLPSLNNAKALARSVVCQSNLKQILYASALYSEDHEGYIEPTFIIDPVTFMATGGGPESLNKWTGILLPYLGGSNLTEFSSSKDLPVASCPESPLRFGYGHNYYGLEQHGPGVIGWHFIRLDEVKHPGSTVHFVDNIDARPGEPPSNNFIRWKEFVRPGGGGLEDIPPYFVHPGEKANVGWVDTHVDAMVKDGFFDVYDFEGCYKKYWDSN